MKRPAPKTSSILPNAKRMKTAEKASNDEHELPEIPMEVWLHIFSFCSIPTLGSVAQVSTLFNAYSKDDALWKDYVEYRGKTRSELVDLSFVNPVGVPIKTELAADVESIKNLYPEKLIALLGGALNFSKLPRLRPAKKWFGWACGEGGVPRIEKKYVTQPITLAAFGFGTAAIILSFDMKQSNGDYVQQELQILYSTLQNLLKWHKGEPALLNGWKVQKGSLNIVSCPGVESPSAPLASIEDVIANKSPLVRFSVFDKKQGQTQVKEKKLGPVQGRPWKIFSKQLSKNL